MQCLLATTTKLNLLSVHSLLLNNPPKMDHQTSSSRLLTTLIILADHKDVLTHQAQTKNIPLSMRCGTIQYSIVWRNCYRLESSHAIMTLYYVLGSPNLISAHRISTLTTIPVDHSHPTTLQKQHYQTIKLVFLYNCTARYRTVHIKWYCAILYRTVRWYCATIPFHNRLVN